MYTYWSFCFVSFVLKKKNSSSEEISRSHEMIQKLQTVLESERENCGFVSEQRLKLQQENEQLQKETEDLRRVALEAQKKAKLKVFSKWVKCILGKNQGIENINYSSSKTFFRLWCVCLRVSVCVWAHMCAPCYQIIQNPNSKYWQVELGKIP